VDTDTTPVSPASSCSSSFRSHTRAPLEQPQSAIVDALARRDRARLLGEFERVRDHDERTLLDLLGLREL